ncbi:MAG: glycosyltransferase family 4 protein [Dysgonamonadaceae bacterium]|nr:glycosyltransferase family 4 protein [Dysgonamonadaceae bacterium]
MIGSNKQNSNGILVYTTGDFPYGMAPESLVRQMTLGFKNHNVRVKVIRLRGESYGLYNDTEIEVSNFLFSKVTKNELAKFTELIATILLIPFSVLRNVLHHRYNTVILYGVEYFYQIFPFWIICKFLKIKLIRITTDYYRVSTVVPVWWKKPKLWFYNFQFKHFDRYLDGIISLSTYMANMAIANGAKAEKVLVIPHFIDVLGFCEDIEQIKHNDRFRIGYCGTVVDLNGVFDLIEAFLLVHSSYPNTELFIIGNPTGNNLDRIKAMTENIKESVIISGLLSKKEVPKALLSCNVLVNPRKSGIFAEAGFPTKLGEYFATSLPVISTKVGDIKNYFTNKKELILINPDTPVEIAESIIWLMKNYEEAKIIGKSGNTWAIDNLDYMKNTNKILKFVQL